MPCITTNCPWQPYFFGRKGDPKKGFTWTYHFFWGLEDVIARVPGAVGRRADQQGGRRPVPQRRRRQCLGRCQARPAAGARQAPATSCIDPGRYQLMNNDFTSQISAFKAAGARDRHRQHDPARLRDLLVAGGAAGLQAEDRHHRQGAAVPLGDRLAGRRAATGSPREIWWTPNHPFKSGLTGQSAQQLTDAYTKATNRPWTQPIGFQHALFEVAIDVLKRAKTSSDPKSILEAIVATNYQSIVGPVQWTGEPVKNVTKTPLVAGQWQRKGGKFELVITDEQDRAEHSGRRQAGAAVVACHASAGVAASACRRRDRRTSRHDTCHADPRPRKYLASASAPWWSPTASTSRSPRARRSASSGRTAPARPRCSASSPARSRPTPAASLFAGEDITRLPPERRCRMGIARSFQIPQPFAGMTVFENVVVAAAFGGGEREARGLRRLRRTARALRPRRQGQPARRRR